MSALAGRRRRNFLLFVITFMVLLIGGWTTYWFIASAQIKAELEAYTRNQAAQGTEISYSSASMSGYPFRFVLNLRDPRWKDAASGLDISGEDLRLVAQAYNPYHVIAFLPENSQLTLANGSEFDLKTGPKSLASLRFATDWTPSVVVVELPEFDARNAEGLLIKGTKFSLGLRPMPDNDQNLQAAVSVASSDVGQLPEDLSWLGSQLQEAVVFLEVENFYPLLRRELSETAWRVDGNKLKLARGEVIWGPLDLATRADVILDRDYRPEGSLGIHLEKTDELIVALEGAGLITDQEKPIIRTIGIVSAKNEFTTVQLKEGGVYYLGQRLSDF